MRQTVVELLRDHFDLKEIRDLCFALNIDIDNIGGAEGRDAKAQALFEYMNRRLELPELVEEARKARPKVNWPKVPAQTLPVLLDPMITDSSKSQLVILPTGYTDLDALIGGYFSSTLNVIAARPGMGKTAFVTSIALVAARRFQTPVLYFNLQMSNPQLQHRIVASISRLEPRRMVGELPSKELELSQHILEDISQLPLYLIDIPYVTLGQVIDESLARTGDTQFGLIVIDGVEQLANDLHDRVTKGLIGDTLPGRLKHLAMSCHVPVLVTLQLGSQIDKRLLKTPGLTDLPDEWGFFSDLIISIYRDDYYDPWQSERPNVAEINVLKNRNSALGQIELFWHGQVLAFRNLVRQEIEL
jgi:replicative DNA helicase